MHAGVSRSRWRALEKTSLGLTDASRRDTSDAPKGAHQLAFGAAAAPSQGHHLLEQLPLATAGLISSAQPPFFGTPEPWLGHLMCPEQGQLITRALVQLIPLLEQCKSTSCTTRWVLQLHERHRRGEEDTTVLIGCTQSEMSKIEPRRDRGDESESMIRTPFCRRAKLSSINLYY